MPFYANESINQLSDAILRVPIARTIANNPIYTALLIVTIIVIIITFVFRDVDSEEGLTALVMRSGFAIFLFLVGSLFLHNKVLYEELNDKTKTAAYDEVFRNDDSEEIVTTYQSSTHRSLPTLESSLDFTKA